MGFRRIFAAPLQIIGAGVHGIPSNQYPLTRVERRCLSELRGPPPKWDVLIVRTFLTNEPIRFKVAPRSQADPHADAIGAPRRPSNDDAPATGISMTTKECAAGAQRFCCAVSSRGPLNPSETHALPIGIGMERAGQAATKCRLHVFHERGEIAAVLQQMSCTHWNFFGSRTFPFRNAESRRATRGREWPTRPRALIQQSPSKIGPSSPLRLQTRIGLVGARRRHEVSSRAQTSEPRFWPLQTGEARLETLPVASIGLMSVRNFRAQSGCRQNRTRPSQRVASAPTTPRLRARRRMTPAHPIPLARDAPTTPSLCGEIRRPPTRPYPRDKEINRPTMPRQILRPTKKPANRPSVCLQMRQPSLAV